MEVGRKALAVAKTESNKAMAATVVDKKVLDEDSYTEKIEKIIVRDFFPDLPRLQAQSEYLAALESNDTAKLRELQSKNTTGTSIISATPSNFETPSHKIVNGSDKREENESMTASDKEISVNPEKKERDESDLTLDKFLHKVNSEDNVSFEQILSNAAEKHKQKHSWLYDKVDQQEEQRKLQLALPTVEEQASISSNTSGNVIGWDYTPKNEVMYVPDGKQLSVKEKIELCKNPRLIDHQNTRFAKNPFSLEQSRDQVKEAASAQAQNLVGKIGIDGKEAVSNATPRVKGYNFLATPSPRPGVDDTPLMTWGEIDGTPYRLDGSQTPTTRTPGPTFKIPDVPPRDRIAMNLTEQVIKEHRAKKRKALNHVNRLKSPAPRFGSVRSTERLNSMSPAAQRLATAKLGVRMGTQPKTPGTGPRTPHSRTPDIRRSVRSSQKSEHLSPSKPAAATEIGLTDNLLNLPSRAQAKDFF